MIKVETLASTYHTTCVFQPDKESPYRIYIECDYNDPEAEMAILKGDGYFQRKQKIDSTARISPPFMPESWYQNNNKRWMRLLHTWIRDWLRGVTDRDIADQWAKEIIELSGDAFCRPHIDQEKKIQQFQNDIKRDSKGDQ